MLANCSCCKRRGKIIYPIVPAPTMPSKEMKQHCHALLFIFKLLSYEYKVNFFWTKTAALDGQPIYLLLFMIGSPSKTKWKVGNERNSLQGSINHVQEKPSSLCSEEHTYIFVHIYSTFWWARLFIQVCMLQEAMHSLPSILQLGCQVHFFLRP